jgi:chemotaxis response regulator CheB
VDLFLTSLADAMGARAIGIILPGYDGDGTEGCRSIKAKGGTTFCSGHVCRSRRHASQCSGLGLC